MESEDPKTSTSPSATPAPEAEAPRPVTDDLLLELRGMTVPAPVEAATVQAAPAPTEAAPPVEPPPATSPPVEALPPMPPPPVEAPPAISAFDPPAIEPPPPRGVSARTSAILEAFVRDPEPLPVADRILAAFVASPEAPTTVEAAAPQPLTRAPSVAPTPSPPLLIARAPSVAPTPSPPLPIARAPSVAPTPSPPLPIARAPSVAPAPERPSSITRAPTPPPALEPPPPPPEPPARPIEPPPAPVSPARERSRTGAELAHPAVVSIPPAPAKPSRSPRRLLAPLGAIAAAFAIALGLTSPTAPQVRIVGEGDKISAATELRVEFESSGRGLAPIRVELEQDGWTRRLANEDLAPAITPWGRGRDKAELRVRIAPDSVSGLRDGQATLRAVAERRDRFGAPLPPVAVERALEIRFEPPAVELRVPRVRVAQGGVGLVIYEIGETATTDGVAIGARSFRGHPLGDRRRFALFAVPHDDTGPKAVVFAEDELHHRRERSIELEFSPRPMTSDTLRVDDAQLETIVPRVLASTPGFAARPTLLESYVAMNGELRAANAAQLRAIALGSPERFLWRHGFSPMPGKVVGAFADRRTYEYRGKVIDRQDHLGFDIASTKNAPIPTTNDGQVSWAGPLGIFGNAVVIDHGYGLSSLYAHLSTVEVHAGEAVRKGQIVGRTGITGLALGDHCHFTMLLEGWAVNPVEWWSPRWVDETLGELPHER